MTNPFTEDFTANSVSWGNGASSGTPVGPVGFSATGGAVDDGGYISYAKPFTTADTAQAAFRGQDNFDSSGDAFAGNWVTAGVDSLSFYVRHNAANPIRVGARVAPAANTPGARHNGFLVDPNTWTQLTIPITAATFTSTEWAWERPTMVFEEVFASVANLQVYAQPGNTTGAAVTVDLDRVSLVPEPAAFGLLAVTAATLAPGRRRRRGA